MRLVRRTIAFAAALCAPFFALALTQAQVGVSGGEPDWAKERQFWSLRSPKTQARPVVKNRKWPRQPLDYFLLARMEKAGLAPSPEADKRTLIRRLTFDLTGLPPTPEEVDAFLRDQKPRAYERLVERLLGSPRFGERLASMWLPLARYAEDQAHQVGSDTKFFYPNAHKYRDWVIGALNRDLPYDRFIKLQLAADFYLSTVATKEPEVRPVEDNAGAQEAASLPAPATSAPQRANAPTTQPELAALGLLGLGPKYYNRGRLEVIADEWEDRVDTVTRTFMGLTVSCARCHDHKFDPVTAKDYYALAGVFASTKMINRRPDGLAEKADAKADQMDPATLHVVEEGPATNLNVFIRGNVQQKGPVVERRFLRVLCEGEPAPFKEGSGRRELAEAIASRTNPLTARVIVNRIWGVMFGKPLVSTPSNFGRSGSLPTHPELLDDLSVRFMDNGWSVKSIVREIALSSAYRQSSGADVAKVRADAANMLLSRMNRRRLTVEQWRDAVLFVSGELKWDGGNSQELDDPNNLRRTVCARISRLRLNDMLAQFDYPDANVHAEKRAVTTTPTQKLFMLNSPFMLARAKALAGRLTANGQEDDMGRVRRAYRLLFGREVDAEELKLALDFLRAPAQGEMTRWEQYAQVLMASNEMLYLD
jgi:hypothetical protein